MAVPRWFPVRVAGDSMSPTVRSGDLLAARALHAGEPRVGQIVVARIDGREVVKRVADVGESGVRLLGDNPSASTDSRSLGSVPRNALVGVVVFRYWPLRRVRPF